MKNLDHGLLQKFIKLAGDQLSGKWIVIGGTVLPLVGIDYRITMDIDFVPQHSSNNDDTLKLMSIAETLGLPVETINQAGAHYLHRIKNYEHHLILLHKGKKAEIYRPDCNLFIHLKLGRLSETDLLDCQKYLEFCKNNQDKIDYDKLSRLFNSEIKSASTVRKEAIKKLISITHDS